MRVNIRALIGAAALALCLAPAAAAQTGAVLSGVVHDRAGNPVPGVVMTVIDPTQRAVRVVLTDERGAYFVDRLDYGKPYYLQASHPRFRHSRVDASANEGETLVDVTLHGKRHVFTRVALFPLHLFRWVR
jgi:hypothetical protein